MQRDVIAAFFVNQWMRYKILRDWGGSSASADIHCDSRRSHKEVYKCRAATRPKTFNASQETLLRK